MAPMCREDTVAANVVYRNTLIENDLDPRYAHRTWYSHEYPQDVIDNYLPTEDTQTDNYQKVIFDDIEHHYFMIGAYIQSILTIRKYQN